jgi:cytidyltransferase-like protein
MKNLDSFLALRKKLGQTLTLVTGVFDVLHEEHINFLRKAKASSDLLLVGIETDVRVRQMKGVGRPINPQDQRLQNLQKLKLADFVFILPEKFAQTSDHQRLINLIKPDFMAVSANTAFQAEKAAILARVGAKLLVVHDFNPAFSTSKLINNLHQQSKH